VNKRDTIAAIGKKTRLRNHDVQQVIETLLEIWTEELAAGGRIEIQNFLVLEVQTIRRQGSVLVNPNGHAAKIPAVQKRVRVSASKYLRRRIRGQRR
jgi:nucleoid DNA-binding protein